MALANGLSSQLLQSLSPSLLAPQAEPAKLFPPALTPSSSSSSSLTPSTQPLSSPFSLSSILQDKTESIQDLRFETFCKIYFKVYPFFVNQDESEKTPGSSWAL